jgi:hypothetical protein
MLEPKASHPYWPDALDKPSHTASGLKPWSWALERLKKSHNYWIATSRPDGRPHLMIVWGVWWQDAFWFSTGPRTRKAKNLAGNGHCAIATEKSDEAVILEGTVQEVTDRAVWKELVSVYNHKYCGDIGPLLESSGGSVFCVTPQTIFGQDEHAKNFTEAVTRWTFTKS